MAETYRRNIIPELFAAIAATVIGALAYLSRIGLENDGILILKSIMLALILLFAPLAIKIIFRKTNSKEWYFASAFLTLICLSVLVVSGRISQILDIDASYLFAFLGMLFLLITAVDSVKNGEVQNNVYLYLLFVFFSVWIACVVWGFHTRSPLIKEKIITAAFAHRDVVFHASIAGMLKTYGVSSTGLDGLVPFAYHVASHYIYGSMSALLCIDAVTFYHIVAPIIFIPLFFYCFVLCVGEVSEYFSTALDFPKANEADLKYWVLLIVLFVHLVPFQVGSYFNFEGYVFLASDSYTTALTFSFILINLLLWVVNKNVSQETHVAANTVIFFAFLAPLLYLVISLSKISFLYCIGIGYGYIFVRLKLYKRFMQVVMLGGFVLVTIWCYQSTIADLRGLPARSYAGSHVAAYYKKEMVRYVFFVLPSFVYIFLKIYCVGIKRFDDLKEKLRDSNLLDVELLLVLSVVLFIPTYPYFKGIQLYVAYVLILSHYNLFYDRIMDVTFPDRLS